MADVTTGVVFKHTVESLLDNTLRARKLLTPALTQELADAGVDVDKPRDIPFFTWERVLRICSTVFAPNASHGEALYALGQAFVAGYVTTTIGKTTLMNGRLIGPKRMIMRMAETWSTLNNIYVVKTSDKGQRAVEVEVNVSGEVTQYNRGALVGTLHALNTTDPRVDATELPDGGTRFTAMWSAP
jgi:uncharacterized protein (TIGR02265 family)